jgi:uncharacterized protein (TIGR00255 family)
MTAYAREQLDAPWGLASWELRSVNHRFLDATVRLPEELRSLESAVRDRIGKALHRGKLDCTLRLRAAPGAGKALELDLALARRLAEAGHAVATVLSAGAAPLSAADVLRWPGVIEDSGVDLDTVGKALLTLLDTAVDELVDTREREGAKLRTLVLERCREIERIVGEVRQRLPAIIDGQRQRLRSRLAEVAAELDPARLEQEIVLFAQKIDVSEELDRLEAHASEVREVVDRDGPIGRRLDFLMQELNREANTLASKSADTQTTRAAVDLKVLIEQIREQVQNLE